MLKPVSIYKQVGFASIIMMLLVFLSRVIGLGREMSIAYMAGAGADVDAYQIAFVIPEILNFSSDDAVLTAQVLRWLFV